MVHLLLFRLGGCFVQTGSLGLPLSAGCGAVKLACCIVACCILACCIGNIFQLLTSLGRSSSNLVRDTLSLRCTGNSNSLSSVSRFARQQSLTRGLMQIQSQQLIDKARLPIVHAMLHDTTCLLCRNSMLPHTQRGCRAPKCCKFGLQA